MIDRQKLEIALTTLSAMFNRPLTATAMDLYWQALRERDPGALNAAIEFVALNDHNFPTPARLLQLATGGPDADVAMMAQGVLEKAIAKHGAYASVHFEDPAINAAVRSLGGWVEVCHCDTHEWRAFRSKDFKAAYMTWRHRPTEVRHLDGITEKSGDETDVKIIQCPYLPRPKPRQIGDGK